MSLHVTHYEQDYTYIASEMLMVAKKIGRLSRYCRLVSDESSAIRIETRLQNTKKERDRIKVDITITLPHRVLRAESRKPKALDAVDRCCEKLESQIEKYKNQHLSASQKRSSRGL